MANSTTSGLDNTTVLDGDDLLLVSKKSGGTYLSRNVKYSVIQDSINKVRTDLSPIINSKANQTDLDLTNAQVNLKADQADLIATNATVTQKANTVDVYSKTDLSMTKRIQDANEVQLGAGANGWTDLLIQLANGMTQREFNEKVRYKNIKLQEYVTSSQNGDASLALLAAMNAAKAKGVTSIDFEAFEYTFKTPITINALSNVTLDASEAILRDVNGLATVVEFTSATNVRIKLNSVIGIDDYARHQAVGAAFQFFFKFTGSKHCQVYDAYVLNKRSLVQFYDCTNCKAFDNTLQGFLPNVDFTVSLSNTNYLPFISISGGNFNKAYNNHADNHGSVVLWGRESQNVTAWGNTGAHLHDNGIYGSSGHKSIAFANSFDNVRGTGVKQRGSYNLTALNTLSLCGVSVAATGNGTTADSFGANGAGSILAMNASTNSQSYAVSVDTQDGLLPRGFLILFNTLQNHAGTATFAPIVLTQKQGCVVAGNSIGDHGADMGINVGGLAARDRNNGLITAINITNSAVPLMRTVYGAKHIGIGNLNIGSGQVINNRYTQNAIFVANQSTAAAVTDSTSYPSEDLLIVANGGAATNLTSIATSVVEGNKNTSPSVDVATIAPTRVSMLVRDISGKPYVSALQGSPATLQWKPLFDKPVTDTAVITLSTTSVAASAYTDVTATVTGAKFGDHVQLSYNQVPSNFDLFSFSAFVSAADTVTIRRRNVSGATATIGGCGAYVRVTARV